MSPEQEFSELEDQALKMALDSLNEKGSRKMSATEALALKIGIACGIKVVIRRFLKEDARMDGPTDYFAE